MSWRLALTCTLSASPPSVGQTLIHDDPGFRRAGVDYLREAIGVAGELGATLLVGPFYAHVAWFTGAPPTPDQFRWAVEGFRAVMPDLNRAGVGMAIEPMNRFERLFLPTAADGVRLCAAIGSERIGLMLDTAHMVIEEKDPLAALAAARPWLKHVQTSENDRGTPGTGCVIDWTGLFRTLRAIGYPGA